MSGEDVLHSHQIGLAAGYEATVLNAVAQEFQEPLDVGFKCSASGIGLVCQDVTSISNWG